MVIYGGKKFLPNRILEGNENFGIKNQFLLSFLSKTGGVNKEAIKQGLISFDKNNKNAARDRCELPLFTKQMK
jgi:hypothetical protein